MRFKRNLFSKALFLIIPTLLLILGLAILKAFFSPDSYLLELFLFGGDYYTNFLISYFLYITPIIFLGCLSIIIIIILEPIYNKKYKTFVQDIPLEDILVYNTKKINKKREPVSKFLLHYPKLLMPFDQVKNYIDKTKNCSTHIYNDGIVIRFAGTLFNNQYDYEIPYKDIKSFEVKPLKIFMFTHKQFILNLINEKQIIIIYNKNNASEINYISNSLNQKLEETTN